jgi:hypothetical protein
MVKPKKQIIFATPPTRKIDIDDGELHQGHQFKFLIYRITRDKPPVSSEETSEVKNGKSSRLKPRYSSSPGTSEAVVLYEDDIITGASLLWRPRYFLYNSVALCWTRSKPASSTSSRIRPAAF